MESVEQYHVMIHRTLRKIANRMDWKSPATALRRFKYDRFPLWPEWGRSGLIWCTSDEAIREWEIEKLAAVVPGMRLRKPPHRRRRKTDIETSTETEGPLFADRERPAGVHEPAEIAIPDRQPAMETPPDTPADQKSFAARQAERYFEALKRGKKPWP